MSKLDRFSEDYKKLETLERQIKENLKERSLQVKQGISTGKVLNQRIFNMYIQVDYLLRSHSDNIKDDLKNLEKLAFLYQNEGFKYPELYLIKLLIIFLQFRKGEIKTCQQN